MRTHDESKRYSKWGNNPQTNHANLPPSRGFDDPDALLQRAAQRISNTHSELYEMQMPGLGYEAQASKRPESLIAHAIPGPSAHAETLRLPQGQAQELGWRGIDPVLRRHEGAVLDVNCFYLPKLCYCLRAVGCELVDLDLVGRFPKVHGDLHVHVQVNPGISQPWLRTISAPEPGMARRVGPIELPLDVDALRRFSEARAASLAVRICNCYGQKLFSAEEPIAVLPFNEWVAIPGRPDLLASFVVPNDEAVLKILKLARKRLAGLSASDALSGYQSGEWLENDRTRPWLMAQAISEALGQDLQLGYMAPSPSFENRGQKIVLPQGIVQHRMGTCLDLSLLLAGCLERAGLNAVIFLTQGHAFVGFWQRQETLARPCVHTWLEIRGAIERKALVPLEATTLTKQPFDFEEAVAAGLQHVQAGNPVEIAVDVAMTRLHGIHPLDTSLPTGTEVPRSNGKG